MQEYRVGCHLFLQGTFPTQGLNLGLCISGRFFMVQATREAHMHVHMKGWRGGLIILKHSCSFEKWVFILLTSQREIYVFISLEMSLSISGDILSLGNKNILLV